MTDHADPLEIANAIEKAFNEDTISEVLRLSWLAKEALRALAARPVTPAPASGITPLLISELRDLHGRSTQGKWSQGQTSHHTVAHNPGLEPYRVAEFRHAADASFCDAMHADLHALLDEIERLQSATPASAPEALTPAFGNDMLHSTTLHALWSEAAPEPTGNPSADLTWQLGQFASKVQEATIAATQGAPGALSLPNRIAELIEQHGSLRAAARVLECDPGYLSRLQSGEKDDPGALLLRRMGLHQITTYERTQP